MNAAIANSIKEKIKDLAWIETISGLVKPLITVERILVQGQPTLIRKTFPISCDMTHEVACQTQNLELIPDRKKKSIVYFEDAGSQFLGYQGGYRSWESTIVLVCWANMEWFDFDGCTISPLLIGSILDLINQKPYNLEDHGITKIQLHVQGEQQKSANIFAKWSYSEEQNQYLLFPYDYFALQFKVDFQTIAGGCRDQIVLRTELPC